MEREHAVRLYQKITLDIINRLDDTSKSIEQKRRRLGIFVSTIYEH